VFGLCGAGSSVRAHAGTEGAERFYNIFHRKGMLHASLHKVLGIYSPKSQRV